MVIKEYTDNDSDHVIIRSNMYTNEVNIISEIRAASLVVIQGI